jgi:hypothetical protein
VKTPSGEHIPSSDAFSKALASYDPVSPRHGAILKSWRDHSDKGEQVQLWRSLERAAEKHGLPVPQPADFIGVVLGCTMPAARLNDHSEYVLDQYEKLKREIVEAVKGADYRAGEVIATTEWPNPGTMTPLNYSAAQVMEFFNSRMKSRLPREPWRNGQVALADGLTGSIPKIGLPKLPSVELALEPRG